MSIRKMIGITAMYGLGDILLFGVSYIIIIPVLTRYLTPAEYGVVAILTSVSLLLLSVLQLGLPSAAFRYFYIYKSANAQAEYLGSIWLTSLIVSLCLVGGILGFGHQLWNNLIHNASFEIYAKYIVWGAFFQVVIAFKSVLLRAQERPKLYVALDVAQFVCLLSLILYNVVILHQGILGQVRAVFFTNAVFAIVSAILLLRNVRLVLKWHYIHESIRFAIPVLLGYLLVFFATRANVLIVQFLVIGSAVGIFAIGQQLGNLVQLSFASFEKAWQPFFYRQGLADARLMLTRIMSVIIPASMGMTLALGLFAPEIIPILTTKDYADAWIVLAVSAVGAMFLALSSIINWGIYYAKRSSISTWITLAGAIVNVVACLIFIPHWGVVGAAVATVVSGLIIFLLTIWGIKRFFSAPVNYSGSLIAVLLGIVILIGVHLLVYNVTGLSFFMIQVIKVNALVLYFSGTWAFTIRNDPKVRSTYMALYQRLRN